MERSDHEASAIQRATLAAGNAGLSFQSRLSFLSPLSAEHHFRYLQQPCKAL
jgi:hypothetical protein